MANIFPAAAPTTFRTWKTCREEKGETSNQLGNKSKQRDPPLVGRYRYLSVTAFPQNPQQLEALGPDVVGALVDAVLRDLDLLAVVHVAAEGEPTREVLVHTNQNRRRLSEHTYNSKPLHWSMMSLS